jgi:hypothetical protein
MLFSCNGGNKIPDHSTDLTCVHSFIRCLYEGRFDEAEAIMTTDEASRKCLQQRKFNFQQVLTKNMKTQYRHASVTLRREPVNDSVVVFICEDPVFKQTKPFKSIRRNNEWLVEFAYTCSGNL